ncbi:tripartite tricarboxylate transporter substrate binding protein [Clostridium cochlearium]|uniref:tripartite tricarboxylate transporter substrate binding protein n=1 Tax=Clostridium cochlearium TaxID=1494 RepID=UPI001EDE82F6|nr:tripartite tricarboxylate transporter substrate binding protein [Clostridium cochlearium]MBV1820015.1 tripartite tricarboxylate transporter substrate binding protein [Bacteroidales bacterium MSK.15.36]MCG4571247.1 tripartite tricarboxylate transporter substrate binding protein [Clostridium cochlearium]
MKLSRKLMTILLGVLICTLAFAGCSSKGTSSKGEDVSDYPKKNIELIVAYKAGGGTDVGARILAAEAEKKLGKPLVVVNKPGADGEIGYSEIAKAKPDGYTIGFINLPTFVSLPIDRKTSYSKDDVVPIMNFVYDSGVLVVKGDSKFNTLEDLIKYAKSNPKELTISNNGTGASNHIGAAHFAKEAGIEVTHVPFGGSADMLAALRGDHVQATVAKISEVAHLVKSGELKILASFTEDRLEIFKDVPTLKEKGFNVIFGSARGVVAPKGTPEEIVKKLHDVFKEAMESEGLKEKCEKSNMPLKYMSSEEFKKYIDEDEKYIKEVVPKLGL